MTDLDGALRELLLRLVREDGEVRAALSEALAEAARPAEFLATAAASALAGVTPATLRRWIREGRLVEYRAGRVVRVRRDELEALLAAGGRQHGAATPEQLAARDYGRR